MESIADRLESAADALTTVDRTVPALSAPPGVFGAGDVGVPGRFGRTLHAHWTAVLAARSREAADTAGVLGRLAHDLRDTARDYTDTDDAVARRVGRDA